MADKILKTRIKLKYDTLANWVKNDPVLLEGELAVATIPEAAPANKQLPPVMFKVGDGASKFSELGWASALAADVYDWAKAAARPAYKYGDADLTGFGSAATKAEGYFDKAGSASAAETNAKAYTDEKIGALPAQAEYTLEAGETDGSLVLKKNGVAVGDDAVVAGWADLLAKANKAISDAAAAQTTADAKYTKPAAGIPKADLAAAVQTSLGKADSALQAHQTIETGSANGTIAVAGKDVAVKGLGSAAYTSSTAYATAAQGAAADAALPKATYDAFIKTVNADAIADAKKAGTDAQSALETYKTSNDAKVSANSTAIANLETAVKAGVTFKGKLEALPAVTNYNNGDLIIVGTKEYILLDDGTNKLWVELGDEGSHLTKATADGYYVPLERTVAGIDLKDNVTAVELRTALNVADGATKVVEATVSGWGFTKNVGTVNKITINGESKTITNGVVDLGTYLTEHQSLDGKQDKLTTAQLAAVNSGITAAKVTAYDGYADTISGKQNALTETQLAAVNSGITATKVTDYDGYDAKITALQNKAGLDKVGTVTSVGITTTANGGLKVSNSPVTSSGNITVDIDDSVTFVFDCGSSTENV